MQVRLFRARAMPEAMAQLRSELGAEALILSSRRVQGGVEVTAGLESPAPVAVEPGRRALLERHGISERVIGKLESGPLAFAVATVFRFAPLELAAGARPLLLVGPPGGGKTLTVARLATRLVLAGVRPLVITADARRAGAVEQLAAFTRLLGLTLATASQPASLRKALSTRAESAPVLIDAPGWDLADPADCAEMRAMAVAADAAVALVLPAGLDPAEATDLAAAGRAAGASLLIATRLDLTARLGGILAAADTGLALAEAGIGAAAADTLVALTPAFLAARLVQPRQGGSRS